MIELEIRMMMDKTLMRLLELLNLGFLLKNILLTFFPLRLQQFAVQCIHLATTH